MIFWQKIMSYCQARQGEKGAPRALTKQEIGQGGENAAACYLQERGMRILYRNWRHASLELDLVCEDADGIVFVEVKTRKAQSMTSPLEGITPKKCATLIKAARAWIAAHEEQGAYDKACRFAVAAVSYTENPTITYKVDLYDNAFDLSHTSQRTSRTTMGGRNTPWQPW